MIQTESAVRRPGAHARGVSGDDRNDAKALRLIERHIGDARDDSRPTP